MSEQLKPCPFCGGNALVRRHGWFHVQCQSCETQGPTVALATEAIAAWNRRSGPTEQASGLPPVQLELARIRIIYAVNRLNAFLDSCVPDRANVGLARQMLMNDVLPLLLPSRGNEALSHTISPSVNPD